ncbi:MAG: hypothetical protein ACI9OJ_004059, partial [Myxococcota bacterium]
VSVVDGKATVEPADVVVTLDNFLVGSVALDAFIEEYPTLGPAFTGALSAYVHELVVEKLQALVGEMTSTLVGGLLDGFAYETTFGEAVPIDVTLLLTGATVAEHGINLELGATIATSLGDGVPVGPLTGSLASPSSPPIANFSSAPVAFMVDDDLLNQAAFAAWFAGPLTGLTLRPADLGDVDLSAVPEVFAPIETLTLDLALPPTIGPRTQEDDFPYEVSFGELTLEIDTTSGRHFGCSISARSGFGLQFNESGSLSPRIDTRPKFVDLAVGCFDVPDEYDAGDIAAVIKLGVPSLLNRFVPGFEFELAAFDLSAFSDSDTLAGKSLELQGLTAEISGPEANLLLIETAPLLSTTPAP